MTATGDNGPASGIGAARLRPIERAMRKLADDGMAESDIAWRFRRSPGHIRRVLDMSPLRREPSGPGDESASQSISSFASEPKSACQQRSQRAAAADRTSDELARRRQVAAGADREELLTGLGRHRAVESDVVTRR